MDTIVAERIPTRLFLLALAGLIAAGCTPAQPPSRPASQSAGPLEKFEIVMERLKRAFEGSGAMLLIATEEGEAPAALQYHFEVTHVLHEPEHPGETYTAEVTVRSSSQYATRLKVKPAGEQPHEQEPLDPQAELDDRKPVDNQNEPGAQPEEFESSIRQGEDVDTYDLAYENDRWVLKTNVMAESARLAFDYALKGQP